MAKEWILNMVNGRWGLTKKNRVGPVSAWIRERGPKKIEDWEVFYFEKLKSFLKDKEINLEAKEYLEDLGKTLYIKISEVIRAEVEEVKEEDCIEYIRNLVINRTYEGYVTEKETIYGQLQETVGVKIEPAPDEWDRLYNVDFYIKVDDRYIGLQIKPTTFEHAPEYERKWRDAYKSSHEKFKVEFGGEAFIILSVKEEKKKKIFNIGIVEEIRREIERLKG